MKGIKTMATRGKGVGLFGEGGEAGFATPPAPGGEAKRERHPTMTLRLADAKGNQSGVLYGQLLGGPFYDPSRGIQFVFEGAYSDRWGEWQWAVWEATITGSNLTPILWGLCEGKQSCVKLGDNDAEERERPHVTGIEVIRGVVKGYGKGE
jgi:hypothetical protein